MHPIANVVHVKYWKKEFKLYNFNVSILTLAGFGCDFEKLLFIYAFYARLGSF